MDRERIEEIFDAVYEMDALIVKDAGTEELSVERGACLVAFGTKAGSGREGLSV